MSDSQSDFRIPDPQETAGQAGEATRDAGTDTLLDAGQLEGLFVTGLSTTDLIITGVVALVMLGIMLMPRKALVTSLTAQFADYHRANAAGNSLYMLLVALGVVATVGLLGNLWTAIRFIVPAGGLLLVLLVVFIVTFRGALSSRVRGKARGG